MSVINTNYLALVSQNNLTKSQNSLGTAIERLSSGLRINSAKDDAAGQAIANRFTANINGLSQASRNANDGISIAQTTEGALNEINENLQRIRTLTVQASTGSNSGSDLDSIQAEIGERLAEINRISEQTQFNGVKVLAGDQELKVQVGAHDNQTISVNLKEIDAKALKLDQLNVSGLQEKQIGAATTEVKVKVSADVAADSKAADKATAEGLYAKADGSGYVVKSGDSFYAATYSSADDNWSWDSSTTAVNASDVSSAAKVTQATREVAATGVTAPATLHTVKDSNTHDYVLKEDGKVFAVNVAADGAVTKGAEILSPTTDPLKAIDEALSNVDSLRSELGAVQNRFQSTIANLNNTVNNLSAARSRIEDADYAVEVSNMTRSQILQQAGTSVLAQANQVPQTVLSLLR